MFIGANIIICPNHVKSASEPVCSTLLFFRKTIFEKRLLDEGTRKMFPETDGVFTGDFSLPLVGFEVTSVELTLAQSYS
jgi:hypothetical protein